jgi:hypothetical protein
MQLIKVQSIVLILISFVYAILVYTSYDVKDVNEKTMNTNNINAAQVKLKAATTELAASATEKTELDDRLTAINAEIALLNTSIGEIEPNNNDNSNTNAQDLKKKKNTLVTEKSNINTTLKDENTERTAAATKAVTAAKNAVAAAVPVNDDNKKTDGQAWTSDNAVARLAANKATLDKLDGRKLQEKSIVLVILSVLVLLLDMNGLLSSKDVGDPLQVVVGIMLVVFGINVLVKFNKDDANTVLQMGTLDMLNKDNKKNIDNKTKVAAIFGTIGGVLCAVLGAQVLLKSVVKKRPRFKFKTPSLKSLKRKKK